MSKEITRKCYLKWYGHVKRRDEEHVLGRILDTPVPGKRHGEEDRKPDGKTSVKVIWKVWD